MLNHRDTQRFAGVFSLLLTPFQADGAIDWACYDRYVEWQLRAAPRGIFAVCGSSEMSYLTLDERLVLARRAVELAGDTPVVATANLAPDRQEHAAEIQRMAETGVSAVVLVPPEGLSPDPAELEEYLAALIESAPCPVLLYEWPARQHYLLSAESYARLVQLGVKGIKDTTCTIEGILGKINVAGDSTIFQANTPYLLESQRLGAGGVMATTTTAVADLVVACWQLAQAGDPQAPHYHRELIFFNSLMSFGYPTAAKWVVAQRGVPISTYCRGGGPIPPQAHQALSIWLDGVRPLLSI